MTQATGGTGIYDFASARWFAILKGLANHRRCQPRRHGFDEVEHVPAQIGIGAKIDEYRAGLE